MKTSDSVGNGPAAAVVIMFVVEYEHGRNRYHTVVEAYDVESAKRQFRRDNPHVEMLSCEVKFT